MLLREVTRGVKYSQNWMKGWHCSKQTGLSKPVVGRKKWPQSKLAHLPHQCRPCIQLWLWWICSSWESEMERSRRQTYMLHKSTCIVILCAVLHGVRELWVAWLQRGENRAEERLHMSEILWLALAQNDLATKTNLETMARFWRRFEAVWRFVDGNSNYRSCTRHWMNLSCCLTLFI